MYAINDQKIYIIRILLAVYFFACFRLVQNFNKLIEKPNKKEYFNKKCKDKLFGKL